MRGPLRDSPPLPPVSLVLGVRALSETPAP